MKRNISDQIGTHSLDKKEYESETIKNYQT